MADEFIRLLWPVPVSGQCLCTCERNFCAQWYDSYIDQSPINPPFVAVETSNKGSFRGILFDVTYGSGSPNMSGGVIEPFDGSDQPFVIDNISEPPDCDCFSFRFTIEALKGNESGNEIDIVFDTNDTMPYFVWKPDDSLIVRYYEVVTMTWEDITVVNDLTAENEYSFICDWINGLFSIYIDDNFVTKIDTYNHQFRNYWNLIGDYSNDTTLLAAADMYGDLNNIKNVSIECDPVKIDSACITDPDVYLDWVSISGAAPAIEATWNIDNVDPTIDSDIISDGVTLWWVVEFESYLSYNPSATVELTLRDRNGNDLYTLNNYNLYYSDTIAVRVSTNYKGPQLGFDLYAYDDSGYELINVIETTISMGQDPTCYGNYWNSGTVIYA